MNELPSTMNSHETLNRMLVRYVPSGYDGSIGWSQAAPACLKTVIFLLAIDAAP